MLDTAYVAKQIANAVLPSARRATDAIAFRVPMIIMKAGLMLISFPKTRCQGYSINPMHVKKKFLVAIHVQLVVVQAAQRDCLVIPRLDT
jgi:hypothetical protein